MTVRERSLILMTSTQVPVENLIVVLLRNPLLAFVSLHLPDAGHEPLKILSSSYFL
jgi:hypothetical protein